jgi:tetratricopeptide (TPR) repeat protein
MASGDFTPDDMIEASTITLRERYYVAAFAFKVDYEATWTASFGFDRREPYTAFRTVTSNGRTYQEAYTAYKTVTDWRPANGVDAGVFVVAGYAGKRLNGSPLEPADLVAQAVINGSSTEYNPSFVKGFEVEGFSVPEKKVFESLKQEINTNIDRRVKTHAQGDKQRDWHWNARISHETTPYAVPICHGAFQYGDKEYHVWIAGHDVETIRADELPVDGDKKRTANIGFVPGVIGLIAIIGSAYFWDFVGSSLIATCIALSYGFLRRKALIDYSKSIRNSLLIQMQASNQAAPLSEEEQDKVAKAFQRPERPFFAKTHKDKIVLPALAAFAFFGAVVPNALNPTAIRQRAIAQQASEQAEQERRNAEARAAQEAVNRKAEVEMALKRAQEEAAAQKAEAERVAQADTPVAPTQSQPTQDALPQPNSATPATPPLATVSLLDRAAKCADIEECVAMMLESIDPRSPEALQVAAVRIGELNKAQRGDRKTARALNDKGLAEFKGENYGQAVALLQQASETDPADVEILSNLGYVALQANQIDVAVSALTKSLLIDPRRTSTWTAIAELYAIRGETEKAVRALLIGYEFSGNKEKTIAVYAAQSAMAKRESMRPIFAEAREKISALRSN